MKFTTNWTYELPRERCHEFTIFLEHFARCEVEMYRTQK